MTVAVSLINMKGGVGKTTIAFQLAHAADADGLRVLAVDLDPRLRSFGGFFSRIVLIEKGKRQ